VMVASRKYILDVLKTEVEGSDPLFTGVRGR
jgi:hypothetical protein